MGSHLFAFAFTFDHPLKMKGFATMLYLGYPLPFLEVAIILWMVQVGIIKLVK
jgi:hypothetical protein